MQAAEMAQVLRTIAAVVQPVTTMRPYFTCDYFSSAGQQSSITCDGTTAEDNAACAVNGTAACTLNYQDLNVTSLLPGQLLRVCNPDWPNNPELFYKVAYLAAPPVPPSELEVTGKEAAALYTVARAFTHKLKPDWTPAKLARLMKCSETPGGAESSGVISFNNGTSSLNWNMYCSSSAKAAGKRSVTGLYLQVLSRIEPELSGFHPDLDDALMYHLLRLPSLETLDMQAGFAF
uniref:Uncharacterized protein n=1 Tax=Tetradesmus obliquus TaxID=3088 RepID=A0A383WQ24_TETOB|eukprot:jgi/Sobl393_1/1588/SZX64939.1